MNKVKHVSKSILLKLISIIKNYNKEECFSIFCDPRGGSTWLAEMLSEIPNTVIIDEPFHLNNNLILKDQNFGWRQFIPEDEEWSEIENYIQRLSRGRGFTPEMVFRNSYTELLEGNKIINKIVRGKGFLPWYVSNIEHRYKPVFMIRHPFAMISSMMIYGAWDYNYEPFIVPKTKYNFIYKSHRKFLESLRSKEEQLVALWCMQNQHVLQHPRNNLDWISISYEDLLLRPSEILGEIFFEWNIEIPGSLEQKIKQPSTTSTKFRIDKEDQLIGWKTALSPETTSRLLHVLDYFEVDIYGNDPLPQYDLRKINA